VVKCRGVFSSEFISEFIPAMGPWGPRVNQHIQPPNTVAEAILTGREIVGQRANTILVGPPGLQAIPIPL